MGGLPCRKAAIDGRAATDAQVATSLANLKRVLDCLQTTMMSGPDTFTDEMEDTFLETARGFADDVQAAAEEYAQIASKLEEQARARWPGGPGYNVYGDEETEKDDKKKGKAKKEE